MGEPRDLIRINGVGSEFADLLEAAGVDSVLGQCVVAYEVASEQIVSKHFYFDRLERLTQIGALPAPVEV